MLSVKLLNTFGLSLDIVGAWVLAMDLIKVFSGPRYEHERKRDIFVEGLPRPLDESKLRETKEYQDWHENVRKVRFRGLYIISLGYSPSYIELGRVRFVIYESG